MNDPRPSPPLLSFPDGEALAAAADRIARALQQTVDTWGEARFAGAGGGTPGPIYDRLSQTPLPWEHVRVCLTDDRAVPESHPASNVGFLRARLLRGPAAAATFIGLDQADAVPDRFDVALFGMGADGHTLSWFAGAQGLEDALTLERRVVAVTPDPLPPEAPFGRLTLTRAAVAETRQAFLAITGQAKRDMLERALRPGPAEAIPVRALIDALGERLTVLWAP